MRIHGKFLVGTYIEQTTSCIIRASSKGKPIWKKLYRWNEANEWISFRMIERCQQWRLILTVTAFMSLSCPGKVCLHWPSLMSHNLADASQAPDTKALQWGDNDNAITSPVWPINDVTCWPVSISHNPQDISPELVTIYGVMRKGDTQEEEKML